MKRFLITALATTGLLCGHSSETRAAEFLFYEPELAADNLGQITTSMTAFMREAGVDVDFQAFARFEDFRREIARRQPAFVAGPSWALPEICEHTELGRIAEPTISNTAFAEKTLVTYRTSDEVTPVDKATIKTIAAIVPSGTSVRELYPKLAAFLRSRPAVKLVTVPKDLDAVLAMAFGHADAAFISHRRLEQLKATRPNVARGLVPIGLTEKVTLPAVYATEFAEPNDSNELAIAFSKMRSRQIGPDLLAMLGYDDWKTRQSQRRNDNINAAVCRHSGARTR